jgi:hypothetical protein
VFHAPAVSRLTAKLRSGLALGETDDMALAGILSTQLVSAQFISHFAKPPPIGPGDDVRVVIVNPKP